MTSSLETEPVYSGRSRLISKKNKQVRKQISNEENIRRKEHKEGSKHTNNLYKAKINTNRGALLPRSIYGAMVMMNVCGETNILRCMDIEKRS